VAVDRARRDVQGGVLVRAVVTGRGWSTLAGAHVGDPLAELVWRTGGRRVSGGWLVATGAQYRLRLVAVVRDGRVRAFVATLKRPPAG
jgi:hypothetical protein